ncbi:protein defective in meristem silencing 3, partial [Phtheirospermum japonicum]
QKIQDDLQEFGEKIKHHEDNIKYLKSLKNKLEDSILDMRVAIGKYHTSSIPKKENGEPVSGDSVGETLQHIHKYENSAAAILCKIKANPEARVSGHSLTTDVLGVVATLGKVDDPNLSRVLSEYLGLENMLAVVCKTYAGVRALEGYKDGSIDNSLGIHSLAEIAGRPLENRFVVICLENLRPYDGAIIVDDPQRRLDLLKPKLISGEAPPGFIGFAVNMVTIDNTHLYSISKNGLSLRETLFYNLFSDLQVYKSREDMLNAQSYITHGAISLDGGVIRGPGIFSLGRHQEDIDIMFPCCESKKNNLPANYQEIENQLKETQWKKDRAHEDMLREQAILEHTKCNYEIKKQEFIEFIAESSAYAAQVIIPQICAILSLFTEPDFLVVLLFYAFY